MNYPAMPLGDLVSPRTGTRNPAKGGEGTFTYVDLESVDRETKAISSPKVTICKDAPSRARKIIKANDVLVSIVRPNLNAVALVPPELDNEIASTGFCVLRATERVLPKFIYFAVRSPTFINGLCGLVSGALYPAVTESQVLGQRISVPPLEDQRRIVDVLSRAENIVRMRRQAEQKAKEIIPALFLDMFGDPATNPKGWHVWYLGDLIRSAQYGTSTKANTDGSGVPMIRMGNVDFAGRMTLEDIKFVTLPPQEQQKHKLQSGDILFNRTNSKDLVGKTGIWRGQGEAVAASYFIRVRVDESLVAPDYLWAFMNSRHAKRILFGIARGAIGQSNINAEELRGLTVQLPPVALQRRFSFLAGQALELEDKQCFATLQSDHAFQSLLASVFGERV